MVSVVDAIISRIQALDAAMFGIWVVAWVTFAFAAGGIAQGKGRQGGGYVLLGLLLSPLIGMIVVFCLSDERRDEIASLRARVDALQSPNGNPSEPSAWVAPVDPVVVNPSGVAVTAAASSKGSVAVAFVMVGLMIAVGVYFTIASVMGS